MEFSLPFTTTVTQYLMVGMIALAPSLLWGAFFLRKSRIDLKQALFSFFAGGLSVIPMLIWQKSWNFSLSFAGLDIPHINVYQSVRTLAIDPGWGALFSFIASVLVVGFLIFVIAWITIVLGNALLHVPFKTVIRNLMHRTAEEPLLFFLLGIGIAVAVAGMAVLMPNVVGSGGIWKAVYISFWASMMVGYLEEYSKHLVTRFQGDHAVVSVDSAIQYSMMVALGFAFVENIIYVTHRIWLAPCSPSEIATKQCLLDPATGAYIHQVGVILIPYIFRSLLSTVAHVVFSGIFGYYYGLAHFASYELKRRFQDGIWTTFMLLLRGKRTLVFHEAKIFQGLVIAMFVHGMFDFVLDQEKTYLTVPILFGGVAYLLHLLREKENQKQLRLIVDERTSEKPEFQAAVENIALLEKFEKSYGEYMERKKDPMELIEGNVKLLEKYEKMWKRK